MNEAIFLLRGILAVILFAHAAQKTLGWFGGAGLPTMARVFGELGLRPGAPLVIAAAVAESVAAVLIGFGAALPLGCVIAAATMGVAAITLFRSSGTFWNSAGGGEYPLVLAAMAVALSGLGAGPYSLDAAFIQPALAPACPPCVTFAHSPLVMPVVITSALLAAVPFALLVIRGKR